MDLLKNAIAYAKNDKETVVGKVVGLNKHTNKVSILVEEEVFEFDMTDAVIMEEIGKINGDSVYEKDIFGVQGSDVQYIIQKHGNERVSLSIIDNETLAVTKFVEAMFPVELAKYNNVLGLVENKYFLLAEQEAERLVKAEEAKKKDFNIKIVKTNIKLGHFEYFYVGNNKEENTVDLIKVIYMGHLLLKEESYERTEIPMDEFLHVLEKGYYVEVSPQELANYVTGMLSFVQQEVEDDNDCHNCDCGENEGCNNVLKKKKFVNVSV